jgi:hypothetical protein
MGTTTGVVFDMGTSTGMVSDIIGLMKDEESEMRSHKL